MALHPLDRSVASDLSQLVLEKRRRERELATPALDSQNCRLYPLPSQIVQREAFIASRETVHDATEWEIKQRQLRLQRG